MKLNEVLLKEDVYSEAVWFVADRRSPEKTIGPFSESQAESKAAIWPSGGPVQHNGAVTPQQMDTYFYRYPKPWPEAGSPKHKTQLVIIQVYQKDGNDTRAYDKTEEILKTYFKKETGSDLNLDADVQTRFRYGRVTKTSIGEGGILLTRGFWIVRGEPLTPVAKPGVERKPIAPEAPATSREEEGTEKYRDYTITWSKQGTGPAVIGVTLPDGTPVSKVFPSVKFETKDQAKEWIENHIQFLKDLNAENKSAQAVTPEPTDTKDAEQEKEQGTQSSEEEAKVVDGVVYKEYHIWEYTDGTFAVQTPKTEEFFFSATPDGNEFKSADEAKAFVDELIKKGNSTPATDTGPKNGSGELPVGGSDSSPADKVNVSVSDADKAKMDNDPEFAKFLKQLDAA